MFRRFFPFVVVALTVALSLSACAGAAESQSPAGDEQHSLTLGWTPGAGGAQVPIAKKTTWAQANVNVTVNPFTSGREALESLLGGGLDAAVLAEFPAVTAALNGSEVVVVDSLTAFGSFKVIGSRSQGISDDLSSLNGKTIATTLGTNMQFLTEELLAKAGIKAELVNVGPADIVSTLARGDAAGAVMFDSFYQVAKQTLGNDYVEMPVPADVYTGHQIVAVSKEKAEKEPEAVQALVNGLVAAAESIKNNPEEAQNELVTLTGGTLTKDYLSNVWDQYDFTPGISDQLRTLMVREGKWIQTQGKIAAGLTINDEYFRPYLDDSFVKAARK